jgi:hypothetical protein
MCDPLGDIVKYEKFRDRINVGLARLFNRNFNKDFKTWQLSDNTYEFRQRANKPEIINAKPEWHAPLASDNFLIEYARDGSPGFNSTKVINIDFKFTRTVTKHDNNNNNLPVTYTFKRVVPGSSIIMNPLPHPDEFTLTDPSDNTILYQATWVNPEANWTYQSVNGYASPVLSIDNPIPFTNIYTVPGGLSTINLTQRSTRYWPRVNTDGRTDTKNESNSQWNVTYTKYRWYNIRFRLRIPSNN